MSSTRILTTEQFMEGTTIDGDRIDRAMSDLVDAYNHVPAGNVARRHFATQFVAGFQPATRAYTAEQANSFPFLKSYNSPSQVFPGGTVPPGAVILNPYRVKGSYNPGIDPTTTGSGDQLIWTQMYAFTDPVILQGISVWMVGDSAYLNNFIYGAGTPGHTAGLYVDDILLEVSIASASAPEDTIKGSLAYHKLGFKSISEASSPNGAPTITHGDMSPAHPAGLVKAQIAIADLNLNVPLPRDARLRFSILIPEYSAGVGAWRQAAKAWMGQQISSTITVLETTVGQ